MLLEFHALKDVINTDYQIKARQILNAKINGDIEEVYFV